MRRLALVTGGTSGIGLGVARALGADHDLALAYASDHARAEAAGAALRAALPGTEVMLFAGPLRGYDGASALAAQVRARFSRAPAVLVNAAGRPRDALFLGSDFAQHEALCAEHLLVTMGLTHALLRDMYREGFGRVVNISSISARWAKRGQCSYAAAKAGVEAFTRTLALEVAHRGITVNAIAPGLIATPLTEGLIAELRAKEGGLAARIPAGGPGTPDDVGTLARFLCSDAARYITGAVHTVDGGRSLGETRA